MPDFLGGDFGGDLGGGWSFLPGSSGSSGVGNTGSSGTGSSTGSTAASQPAWWQVLLTDGLGAYRTYLAYDLQNEQVGKGQYPGLTGQGGFGGVGTAYGGGGAGLNLSSLVPLIVIVLVAVVGFSLLKSVLK